MPDSTPSPLSQYREALIGLEQKAQSEFDRTVMALSGGALGVTFAFVDKFIRNRTPVSTGWLFTAWIAWSASLTLVLAAHYFSAAAMRKAIAQVDAGKAYTENPGGGFDTAIKVLNALGGFSFIAGVLAAAIFVYRNI